MTFPMKPSSRRREPKKISGLVGSLIQRWTEQSQQQGALLNQAWLEAVGEKIAARSRPVRLQSSKLLVSVESAAWMNELTYLKENIKLQVKKTFFQHGLTVEEVVFKLGLVKKTAEQPRNVPPSGK